MSERMPYPEVATTPTRSGSGRNCRRALHDPVVRRMRYVGVASARRLPFAACRRWMPNAPSGGGEVYSFSIVHRGADGFVDAAPYVLSYVTMDGGPTVLSNVVGDDCLRPRSVIVCGSSPRMRRFRQAHCDSRGCRRPFPLPSAGCRQGTLGCYDRSHRVRLEHLPDVFRTQTFAHTAVGLLREMILSGGPGPGERLNELAIAEQFKISRSPIREAIRALAGEDWCASCPVVALTSWSSTSSP